MKKTLLASMVAMSLGLAGCSADGNGAGDGNGPVGDCGADGICGNADDNGGIGPNDGSTPTTVGEDQNGDGTISDDELNDGTGFVCSKTASDIASPIRVEVGTRGLVGGLLTNLLNLLGGNSLTTLLNSVTQPENAIDGYLSTYATFTSTAAGLGLLDTVDLSVIYPSSTDMKGSYAVFGLTFPRATADVSLLSSISLTTYKGSTEQEKLSISHSSLDLLGLPLVGGQPLWFGIKTSKDYDRATLSLGSGLLSANVGEALHVHELCAGGKLVTPPATN